MENEFTLRMLRKNFLDNDLCLEEIVSLRYPGGIFCDVCNRITKHYKLEHRLAYSCKFCRHQVFPLKGTVFEKTTTPLPLWFYALYLMSQTKAQMPIKTLQRELGVTYKTAWRMYYAIYDLMQQNNADLLPPRNVVRKWVLFNTFEIKLVQRSNTVLPEKQNS